MTAAIDFPAFLKRKTQLDGEFGFEPLVMPEQLYPFQQSLLDWAVRRGRAAIFADCGMGKTVLELAWAENVVRQTGQPVLILTPLAVAGQFEREAEKFGFDAARSRSGEMNAPIVIANYERIHHFRPETFSGVVCDESSILKSYDGARKAAITEFLRTVRYRLLGTATAAPNDYTELGTSSEALGHLGYMDMLSRFFTRDQKVSMGINRERNEWRFKGHAEQAYWRWVASWARALRRPSDLGFPDEAFELPPLEQHEHVVTARTVKPGMLFDVAAIGFHEEREVRRRTIPERCELVAELVADTGRAAVSWCHLNDEGDLLERLIPGAVQVSGRDSDDEKEEKFAAFANAEARVLITKPKIGAWGLNWQHCHHLTYFPSHSYEQYYQAVRRCWRFGQEHAVTVDIVATDGEIEIQANLDRKAAAADRMFAELVTHMHQGMHIERSRTYDRPVEVPTWLTA